MVLLHGARQTGKSTLVQAIAEEDHPARYITLDDATALSAACSDPAGFLAGLRGPVILDEAQRAPDLFLAIKAEVDRRRQPGRFLLTGSAHVLLLPKLAESLVGRIDILTLWPFSQGELDGSEENFIDAAFADSVRCPSPESFDRHSLFERAVVGGFPEAAARRSSSRRGRWFGSYVTTIVQRDVRDIANIEHLTTLPRLLSLLAARTGSLMNYAEFSRSLGLSQSTLKRYMALLETTFLVQPLGPWSANLGKRLVKSPKIMFCDTGLMAHLLGLSVERIEAQPELAGPLLENFAVMELRKQASWSETQPRLFHFRTHTGQEVDIILEDAAGNVVGIEVKAASSVAARDFTGLRFLSEALGERFRNGFVLYTGRESVPFAPNLHAVPLPVLWSWWERDSTG